MLDEISLLKNLVSIPSISEQEQEAVDFLIQETKKLDFDEVKKDQAGNYIAVKGTGKTQILLLGHIDTVPGDIPVEIRDNNLYGRGSVDAKGSLATFISAVNKLKNLDNKQIIIVGTVEEEIASSKGARFILDKYNPEYIVIGEPSGVYNITIGYKGCFRFDYELEKNLMHFSAEEKSVALQGIEFIQNLQKFLNTDGDESIFNQVQLEIRDINTSNNGLKEKIIIKINLRIPPEFDVVSLEEFLSDYPITMKEQVGGLLSGKNNKLIRSFLQSIRNNNGNPKFLKKTGTADFNILGSHFPDIPIIAYGPGDSKLDHTPNEHLDLDEYAKAINILTNALELL